MLRLLVRPTPDGSRALRLVAVAVALQLVAGLGAVVLVRDPAPVPAPDARPQARVAPAAPRVAPPAAPLDPQSLQARTARDRAVRQLLADRAGALLRRDKDSFLSVVDPLAGALRERQAGLFDALGAVPLQTWRYVLDGTIQQPSDSRLDRRYGRDRWWAPEVILEYALEGYDARPTAAEQHLTFVLRAGRWLLAADDDFAATGLVTPRALWDRGPVVAERVDDVLVLGRPSARRLLRNVAVLAAAAVPQVSEVWGTGWQRRVVVLVPTDAVEMAELLGSDGDLTRIAAVATAQLGGGTHAFDPTADRILVNPEAFSRLGQLGRRVVLTHEVTHVATRRATGPAMPGWLAEGFADHIAYRDIDLPLALSARELHADVRDGRLPTALPSDESFDGGNPELAQAYEQAWLAVRLLSQVHGDAALLRFYRAVGAARAVEPAAAVEAALRAELGTTTAQLTKDWRAALQRELG
ncbi:MAG: hypothetical protein WD794_05390 [Mycobacteriales bacterium]